MLAPSGTDPVQLVGCGLASLMLGVENGRTRLLNSRCQPPLQVQRVQHLDETLPDMAFIFLVNPTAGILEGDRQVIEVEVGPEARAHICTPAATKVFSMHSGSASQRVSLVLREGAYLEYLPDAIIPFRDARFSQETTIRMEPGSTLVFSEMLCPGRVGMGESFAFDRFNSQLSVMGPDGSLIYRESFSLEPKKHNPSTTVVMGQFDTPCVGTLLILNESTGLAELRNSIRCRFGQLVEKDSTFSGGVSLLPNKVGLGLKVIGQPASNVARVMREGWAEARRQLLGVNLPALRKY